MANIDDEKMSPQIFVDLLNHFYQLGWVMGSSGGMAALNPDLGIIIYSPSSVQKERLKESDLFVLSATDGTTIRRPSIESVKESACVPLFQHIIHQTGSQCVIHTHSKYSNLLTQLLKGEKTFRISDQEMLKGILNRGTGTVFANTETLVLPIIENAPQEYMLLPDLKIALVEYPETSALLVRNHGLFVWGPTWQKTKIMLECYEYLCELACEMLRLNLDLLPQQI